MGRWRSRRGASRSPGDGHDNVKALIYSTAEFGPGERGIFSVAAAMRVNTFGTERNPYGVDPGDVRLGCGAFNTIDLKTWMVFDFFRQRQPDRAAL